MPTPSYPPDLVQAVAEWLDDFDTDVVNRYTRPRGRNHFTQAELRRYARRLLDILDH